MDYGVIFISEAVGTAMLVLLGCGVVANNLLAKNKGNGTGFLFVNWGWGFAVFAGVVVAWQSGGHINPAVTLGLAARNLATGQTVDWGGVAIYIIAQMIGAVIGAVIMWMAYKKQFDEDAPSGYKRGVFATAPEVRSTGWNLVTEIIGTFVLVFFVIGLGYFTPEVGWLAALPVALLVVGIGISLGGPTGYAINPARDLGPRIAHAFLPIPNKEDSDWSYSWIPVVGPIVGGVLAGVLAGALLPNL